MTVTFDSSAWIEYFSGSDLGLQVKDFVDGKQIIYTPVIDLHEIKAKYLVNNETYSSVIETIDIKTQGDFRLDLILFPNFELEEEILKEAELEVEDLEEKDYTVPIIFAVILGIGIILYLISKLIKSKEEIEADEAKKIIEFIKKHGSRITQKDIRKNFPSSEAKISLILTELEEKGIIKKIKRGRGNIIVLK